MIIWVREVLNQELRLVTFNTYMFFQYSMQPLVGMAFN